MIFLKYTLILLATFIFQAWSSEFFSIGTIDPDFCVIILLYISAGVLSFWSYKALQEKSYTGVMASTGLSYLSLIISLGASGTLILSIWHYP